MQSCHKRVTYSNSMRSVLVLGLAGATALAAIAPAEARQVLPRPNPFRASTAPTAPTAPNGAVPRPRPQHFLKDLSKPHALAAVMPAGPAETTSRPADVSTAETASPALKLALQAVSKKRIGEAFAIRDKIKNRLDRKIVEWQIARSGNPGVSHAFISRFARSAGDWPDAKLLQVRAEIALSGERPSSNRILEAFARTPPRSQTGRLLYAKALLGAGRKDQARKIIRPLWRTEVISPGMQSRILKSVGSLLTRSDHKARSDWLLYRDRATDATRINKYLTANQRKLVAARIAVVRKRRSAAKALAAVPASLKKDPLYLFSRIQYLRRAKKPKQAAQIMLKAPRDPAKLVNPDEWWVERRLISRKLLNSKDYKTAYKIAAGHGAKRPSFYVEAEFHAGWYALRFLKSPSKARRHFQRLLEKSKRAVSQARANYWLGRSYLAAGDKNKATLHFKAAARFTTVYYGQMARAQLGHSSVGLPGFPKPTADDRAAFAADHRVKAIKRMAKAGFVHKTLPLFMHLGRVYKSPGQAAMLVRLAEKLGQHRYALITGKIVAGRIPGTERLAFPTSAIPKKTRIIAPTERPLVYAIARQESAFHPKAISHAGARGLLQLMPATARATARKHRLPYSKGRLTSDPAYNATLGSAHLGDLLKKYKGSYIMTFAAYNAGAGRVTQWVAQYGDPRKKGVDAIDWVERIPFTETRNYVQRIMENLQVYRARFEGGRLTIKADLKRGG